MLLISRTILFLLVGLTHSGKSKLKKSKAIENLKFTSGKSEVYDDVPPLTFAVSSGALHEVEGLLQAGADPNALDWLGQTALHMAAKFQQVECSRALLRHGANPNIANSEYEETPLHLAAKTASIEIMRFLVEHGARVDAPISDSCIPGGTPLLYAALYDLRSSEALKFLLENGANTNIVNSYGETALHISIRHQNIRNVQILVNEYKTDVDKADYEGCTPLNVFARDTNGSPQMVIPEILLEAGADVESRCRRSSRTPLHNAAAASNLAIVDFLLTKGADIDTIDSTGKTPLHSVVTGKTREHIDFFTYNTRLNIVKTLLLYGANPNWGFRKANATEGCTTILLDFVRKQKDTNDIDILKLLVAYGAEINSSRSMCPESDVIEIARQHGNHDFAKVLESLLINPRDHLKSLNKLKGSHPLVGTFEVPEIHRVIVSQNMTAIALLLVGFTKNVTSHDLSVMVEVTDHLGQTALHMASMLSRLSVVRVLLHLGADVNARDHTAATPFHYAARRGDVHIMDMLLEYGAKLEEIASDGTPLRYAVTMSNSPKAVQFILERRPNDGYNEADLIHKATVRQNIRMMALLLKHGADVDSPLHGNGLTALGHLVESDCCYPQLPVLSFLLDHGAYVDARDVNQRTPLNAALALKKRKQVIAFLLSRGANPNSVNLQGCNAPLYRLVVTANRKLSRYFRHSISDESTAKAKEIFDIARDLLEHGANPLYFDRCNNETIMDIVNRYNMEPVRLLLEHAIGIMQTTPAVVNRMTRIPELQIHPIDNYLGEEFSVSTPNPSNYSDIIV